MIDTAVALTLEVARLNREAPDLVAVMDGQLDRERVPGQLALVGQHLRGFRMGAWEFDLLGEGMAVDVGIAVNGSPATYRAVLDTRGNGVYFVHVDQLSGETGLFTASPATATSSTPHRACWPS